MRSPRLEGHILTLFVDVWPANELGGWRLLAKRQLPVGTPGRFSH